MHRYFGWANVIDEFMEERFDTLCKVLVSTFKSMKSQGINPLLVIDGDELPAKNFTKQQRQKRVNEPIDNYNQLMQKHRGAQEPSKHTPIPSSKQFGSAGLESAFTALLK